MIVSFIAFFFFFFSFFFFFFFFFCNWRDVLFFSGASLVAQMVKNLPLRQETWIWSRGRDWSQGEGNGSPLHYSSLGKAHGQKSLSGHSPWVHKESDVTEILSLYFFHHNLSIFSLFLALAVPEMSNDKIYFRGIGWDSNDELHE